MTQITPKQSVKWVFDTVVISNFIFSDALNLLQQRYQNKALITSEVYGELVVGMEKYPKLKEIG
jgi:predicted nucleic acid-binding protein